MALMGAGVCRAESGETDTPDIPLRPVRNWTVSVGGSSLDTQYARNALHSRSDDDDDAPWLYDDGDADGDGYGLHLVIERENERVTFDYYDADYTYYNFQSRAERLYGSHQVDTDYTDWQLMYWRFVSDGVGLENDSRWGWRAGIRRLYSDNDIHIEEVRYDHQDVKDFSGHVDWQMVKVGYFGEWTILGFRHARVYGGVDLMFGNVSGLAREGNDEAANGSIDETYTDEDSLAYGADVRIGLSLDLLQYVTLGADYAREWMYAFDATDSGVVVIPDNNDALFIESHHTARFYLTLNY
jgi:hypothetical protein